MNIGALFNAFDSLRKRDGDLETVVKTVFFHNLMNKYPKKTIREVICDYKGGSWGNDFFQDSIPAKVLRSPDIRFGFIDFQNAEERYFTEKELENYRLKNNDILVIKSNGSLDLVGKSQIFKSNQNFKNIVASNFLMVITPNTKIIYPEYLDLFLKSPEALIWRFDTQKTTTGLRNLNTNAFLDIELPVPESIEEQILLFENFSYCLNGSFKEEDRKTMKFYRIVKLKEKITNELFYQLTQLENLNQAILQEAVKGKLVNQDPNDEPASELLKRIKAEKLNKHGVSTRAKKEKPLPPINPEEIPFEIPENWVWCRLGEIADNVEYGTSQKAEMTSEHIPVLRMNNIQSGKLDYSNLKYVSETIDDLPRLYLKDGDLLFNRTNSYELVGKTAVYRGSNQSMTFASYIIRVQFDDKINSEFISCYINSHVCRETQLEPEIIQQNGQANFNGTKLKNILVPLPPLSEQKRIVAEIARQFTKTKALKEHIIANQQATEQLLKALLHQAFEVGEAETEEPLGMVAEPGVKYGESG